MELIQHEIQVIKVYNRFTKSAKTTTFKKGRYKKAIELNLLRTLKNKLKRG
jgi:hypothetical protein